MTELFQLKQKKVEALQFDGTKASAHEILGFVYRKSGSGLLATNDNSYSENAFFLQIVGIEGVIPEDSWVVNVYGNQFQCFTPQEFAEAYEPIPAGPVMRGGTDLYDRNDGF